MAGRLILNDAFTQLEACVAGHGIAQVLELGLGERWARGELVQLFPEWAEERFPLHVFYPSRRLPPAKVRAFLDFVASSASAAARN